MNQNHCLKGAYLTLLNPSPSTRGWQLSPPSSLGKKNNFKGRRPTDQKEKEEDCSVCLAPLWDNTMLFQTACKHAIHGHCMRGVFQHGITAEQRNMCPTCKGWVGLGILAAACGRGLRGLLCCGRQHLWLNDVLRHDLLLL